MLSRRRHGTELHLPAGALAAAGPFDQNFRLARSGDARRDGRTPDIKVIDADRDVRGGRERWRTAWRRPHPAGRENDAIPIDDRDVRGQRVEDRPFESIAVFQRNLDPLALQHGRQDRGEHAELTAPLRPGRLRIGANGKQYPGLRVPRQQRYGESRAGRHAARRCRRVWIDKGNDAGSAEPLRFSAGHLPGLPASVFAAAPIPEPHGVDAQRVGDSRERQLDRLLASPAAGVAASDTAISDNKRSNRSRISSRSWTSLRRRPFQTSATIKAVSSATTKLATRIVALLALPSSGFTERHGDGGRQRRGGDTVPLHLAPVHDSANRRRQLAAGAPRQSAGRPAGPDRRRAARNPSARRRRSRDPGRSS